jgi:RNA polymerase sigma factor (sigma-70 family)
MTRLPTDARLARRATGGDQGAFAVIFKRYHQELYRFCLSIVSRPEDAQDALQNTMVKALRSLPGEERQIELKPWLYRVAHNESIELLRKRRESVELQPERLTAAGEPAETAALRERLRRLFDDLELLPERQRGALVMRELGDLDFEQIGEAFDTSSAVARQTVYEARLNLRQLEVGREMSCEQVARQLSEADGRVIRRRDIQAHLRACRECREFRDAIALRRHDLAALAPLPAATVGSILQGLLGGQAVSGGLAGGTAGSVGVGAGKVVATSAAVKAVATVAAVATIGVTAADRGGLIDAGLPGGKSATKDGGTVTGPANAVQGADSGPGTQSYERAVHRAAVARASSRRGASIAHADPLPGSSPATAEPGPARPATDESGSAQDQPTAPPPASQHGQETAAEHKAGATSNRGHSHGHVPAAGPRSSHGPESDSHGATGAEHQAKGQVKKESSASNGGSNGSPGQSASAPAHGKGGSKAKTKEPETPAPMTEPGAAKGHHKADEASP